MSKMKFLKVSGVKYHSGSEVPAIKLQGKWLSAIGFEIGDMVIAQQFHDGILIRNAKVFEEVERLFSSIKFHKPGPEFEHQIEKIAFNFKKDQLKAVVRVNNIDVDVYSRDINPIDAPQDQEEFIRLCEAIFEKEIEDCWKFGK